MPKKLLELTGELPAKGRVERNQTSARQRVETCSDNLISPHSKFNFAGIKSVNKIEKINSYSCSFMRKNEIPDTVYELPHDD